MARKWRFVSWILVCPLLLVIGVQTLSAEGSGGESDEGFVGTEVCAACHEDVVSELATSSHAIGAHWNADQACESCHGPGAKHVDSTDAADIQNPADLSPRESSQVCLQCHERNANQFRSRHSTHTLSQISCVDCHAAHSTAPQMLEARGSALCGECHQAQTADFDLPRSHPMPEGMDHLPNRGVAGAGGCETCHNPHVEVFRTARASRGAQGAFNCMSCHVDKAGPFVFPHDTSIVDGCQSCHTVHGTTNRHLLKHERQVNLCYECHAGTTTPGFHSGFTFTNEKCTACHTAIHGSNTQPFFLEE